MMSDDQILEVVMAHKEGKKIEIMWHGGPQRWTQWENPRWNFEHADYRVAPEPRKPREWEMFASDSDEIFLNNLFPNLKRIVVREVIEEKLCEGFGVTTRWP